MKMLAVLATSVSVVTALAGVPEITQVTMTQEKRTREVTVSYRLSEPAIVTMTFFTNGVALPMSSVRSFAGSLNTLVPAGQHTLTWFPYKDVKSNAKVPNAEVKLTAWATNAPPLYLAVDLTKATDNLRYYPSAEELPYALTDDVWKTDRLLMRRIYASGKEWRMGSPVKEGGRSTAATTDETAHLVTLTADYYMGVYEVTRHQHSLVCGTAYASGPKFPQADVSPNGLRGTMTPGADYDWPTKGHAVHPNSVIAKWRNKAGGHVEFDLPTKAQWEFAGRAGSGTRFGIPNEEQACLDEVAWNKNNGGAAHEVGLLKPNAWGLYDTLGNVGEWCLDWMGEISDGSSVIDPVGPTTGTVLDTNGLAQRSAKGSGFFWGASEMRYASNIHGWAPNQSRANHGYRLCAPAVIK